MTDGDPRVGAARDVPPPRPVPAAAVEENGLGRAARAVADAVAGLVGNRTETAGTAGTPSAAAGLRDVVGAMAGAVGAAFRGGSDESAARPDASAGGRAPTAMLGDLLSAAAPRLPVRDGDRLRRAYPGLSDEQIADAVVERAAKVTTGIGAATGGLAAAQWFATPSLLALPLELGAETVLVAAVELVLVGELHELYGRRPPGDARERAAAYLASWSARRSADRSGVAGLGSLGAVGLRAVRKRLTRRLAGSASSAAPFLIGAALGGRVNRKATETLGRRLRADLRASLPPADPGPPA